MSDDERTGTVSRRTALSRGAAVTASVGAAGLLAACGVGAGAGTEGAGGSGGSGGGAAADPIPASDIPVGSAKIFPDRRIVVAQPTAGEFKAFSAVCTHAGCTVNKIQGNTV